MSDALFAVLLFWLILVGFVGSMLLLAWGLNKLD